MGANVHFPTFCIRICVCSMHVHITIVLIWGILLAYLHHAIDQCLIVLVLSISAVGTLATRHQILFPLGILLRYEAHGQLAYVDWVVGIMLNGTLVSCHGCSLVLVYKVEVDVVNHCLLLAHMTGSWCLNGSKSATTNLVVNGVCIDSSILNSSHLLLSDSLLLSWIKLLTDFFIITTGSITIHVIIGHCVPGILIIHLIWLPIVFENALLFVRTIRRRRKKSSWRACLAHSFVLCVVESWIIFCVMSSSCASSYTRDMRCVAVFTLYGLDGWVIEIYYKIFVNGIFVWTFWITDGRHNLVHSSSLGTPVVRSYPIILSNYPVLLVILNINTFLTPSIVLNGTVVNRIVPNFCDILDGGAYNLIEFPAFLLVRVQWRSHVQILLVVCWDVGHWGSVDWVALTLHDSLILGFVGYLGSLLDGCWHLHLSFKIQFWLLVTLLAILQLFIPAVDQVVASSDMVMPVILNTLLSVLPIKVEFLDNFIE